MQPPPVDPSSGMLDRLIGGLLWAAVAALVVFGLIDALGKLGGREQRVALANYWTGRDPVLQRKATAGLVAAGDPVFYRHADGSWTQVGYVEAVTPIAPATRDRSAAEAPSRESLVSLRWHDSSIDPGAVHLVAYRNRGTLAEMVQVMFPADKRAAIEAQIAAAMRQHGADLAARFFPLVETSLRRSLPVVEAEFLASLDRHRDEVRRLAERWKEELVRERLLPLAREQLLPIAQRHVEPTMRKIGRELWSRASLWSFTWRAAYDKTPLPRRNLMREEWERFIRQEAIPVIEAHGEELAVAIQRTLAELLRSPAVRDELRMAASLLANDPETRELIRTVLRETVIENEKVRQVWVDVWTSEEAESAYAYASTLLGPLVHKIGEELMGSPQRGIDPGLARLLRHQVLGKDRRWIVASQSGDLLPGAEQARITRGSGDPIYPILHLAAEPLDE